MHGIESPHYRRRRLAAFVDRFVLGRNALRANTFLAAVCYRVHLAHPTAF